MTKYEFLASVRQRIGRCPWHRAQYALECGHVDEPPRDAHGNRNYSRTHVDQMVAYIKHRVKATTTTTA